MRCDLSRSERLGGKLIPAFEMIVLRRMGLAGKRNAAQRERETLGFFLEGLRFDT